MLYLWDEDGSGEYSLDSIGMLASSTKAITCTRTIKHQLYQSSIEIQVWVAMMMHEKGYLDVDTPISEYMSEFQTLRVVTENGELEAATRAPTIGECCGHVSGL